MPLAPGFAVTPNIKLVRELGEGGMGSVWVAEHTTLHTEVAVKFIHDKMATETSLKRFSREASLAAQIKSPHVVQTYDHGATEEGTPYIVMELLEGESLEERLAKGPLGARKVAMSIAQVCKALTKAHKLGIVHRDLKPANLFLVESGYEVFVKVLDFGIAKQTGESSKKTAVMTSELTGARAAIGTPYYMSPEALRASKDLDHRADLWSLAVVAYHTLTGKLPFKAETLGDQLVLVLEERFLPPSHHVSVPDDMDAWFKRAFSHDISERFQNAGQLARSFRGAIGARTSQSSMDDDSPVTSGPDSMLETSSEISGESSTSAEFAATEEATSGDTGVGVGDETQTLAPDNEPGDHVAIGQAKSSPALSRQHEGKSTAERSVGQGSTLDPASTAQPLDVAPSPNRLPLIAAAALLVIVGGYYAFVEGGNATPPSPAVTPSSAAVTPSSAVGPPSAASAEPTTVAANVPSSQPSAEPAVLDVALTIDSIPPRVEVALGDRKLGTAPGPIEVPRADEELEITFSAPGHLPSKVRVKPDRNQTVTVRLRRPQPRPQKENLEW